MRLIKKLSVLSVLSLFAFSLLASPLSMAQESNDQGAGSGLQITPTRTEITAQPGESKTFSISVRNVTQGELNAKPTLNDFKSDDVSGSPVIIIDETVERTPFTISNMLTNLESVNLKPGETKQIEHTINVPGNVAPGAYFGALRYSAVPVNPDNTEEGRQVSLTASVAHLVFVEIPGDVVEQIKIESLVAVKADGKKRKIFDRPGQSSLTVKNLGNGFSRPFGKVALSKGSKQLYTYEINNTDSKSIVLPQSTRVFTDELKNMGGPGKYKLSAGIAYGNGGEVVPIETTFWYLPVWFLGVLALVLIAIVAGGYIAYRKIAGTTHRKKAKKS